MVWMRRACYWAARYWRVAGLLYRLLGAGLHRSSPAHHPMNIQSNLGHFNKYIDAIGFSWLYHISLYILLWYSHSLFVSQLVSQL